MGIEKALLIKSLGELLASVITTNASHRHPRGRDQNKYKFRVR